MSISLREASQEVGLTRQTILKAIRNGRVSAEKDLNGEWRIEPVELFRVWPPVTAVAGRTMGVAGAELSPVAPIVSGEVEALLRAQLDDVRADRDRWRDMAERLTLTDQRASPPGLSEPPRRRWFGR